MRAIIIVRSTSFSFVFARCAFVSGALLCFALIPRRLESFDSFVQFSGSSHPRPIYLSDVRVQSERVVVSSELTMTAVVVTLRRRHRFALRRRAIVCAHRLLSGRSFVRCVCFVRWPSSSSSALRCRRAARARDDRRESARGGRRRDAARGRVEVERVQGASRDLFRFVSFAHALPDG